MTRAAIITFPGSNCDDDLVYTFEKSCGFKVDRLWHKDRPSLADYKLVALPGGFSYGDYLRCGAMAALSPIMEEVKIYAKNGGMVLGVCNGFQILCEVGLLPGALAKNEKLSFVCKDVMLEVATTDSPWTREMTVGEKLTFPIAHGDGRYIATDAEFEELKRNQQILLTYIDNPNGSSHAIAGVSNREKNVFGLMPHPERATDLRSRDGMKLWKSVLKSLELRAS